MLIGPSISGTVGESRLEKMKAGFASDYTSFVTVKRKLIICLPALDPPCNDPRQSLFSLFGSRFVVVLRRRPV